MARTPDEARKANARRLYAMGVSSSSIAVSIGADRRTVQRWCADIIRPPGVVPTPAVPTARIVALRDRDSLPWAQIAALTALSETGVKNRYRRAKGLPRHGAGRG